jgi:hypothetical protein
VVESVWDRSAYYQEIFRLAHGSERGAWGVGARFVVQLNRGIVEVFEGEGLC